MAADVAVDFIIDRITQLSDFFRADTFIPLTAEQNNFVILTCSRNVGHIDGDHIHRNAPHERRRPPANEHPPEVGQNPGIAVIISDRQGGNAGGLVGDIRKPIADGSVWRDFLELDDLRFGL